MKTKKRLIIAGTVLLCMSVLLLPDPASGGPLLCRLFHRHPAPRPIVEMPVVQISPLRFGGKQPVPMLVIGHRGAPAFAPENTMESFRMAVELGAHMIELDVHLSLDGELMVIHDDEASRTTNVKEKYPNNKTHFVSDYTAVDLQALDAGTWYMKELEKKPAEKRERFLQTLTKDEEDKFITPKVQAHYRSGKVRIPRLHEVLEFARSKNVFVNIEPKTLPRQYPGLTAKIVKLVEELKMERQVMITSFDHDALAEVRRLSNVIATGALVSDRLYEPGRYIRSFDADAYNPGNYSDYNVFGDWRDAKKFTPGSMKNALNAGLGVNVWTVNDRGEMEKLIEAGATGLITDYPNRVRDVLAKMGKEKW